VKIVNSNFFPDGTTTLQSLLRKFERDESGATAIEYGLIASLIAVAIIAGATALGTSINTTFNNLSTKMQ
jgi:pilus assembly protein Flp/PilA